MPRPCVFLDKDGTLIHSVPFNKNPDLKNPDLKNPDLVQLEPGASEALRRLQQAGYALVIVANQPGVARGLYSEGDLAVIEARIRQLVLTSGVVLDAFYYCPHDPNGSLAEYACDCTCRKPQPGLLLRAAYELDLDLSRSWMVGPTSEDAETGHRARVSTVLLTGFREMPFSPQACIDYLASDLAAAARIIRGASSSWPYFAPAERPQAA